MSSMWGLSPPVLVDDEHFRQLPRGLGGPDEVAPHGARTRRRGVLDELGRETRVVLRNLLGLGEAGVQGVEQHGGGDAAHGELGRALDEAATIEGAVDVRVEQDQQLGLKVLGSLRIHPSSIQRRPGLAQVEPGIVQHRDLLRALRLTSRSTRDE